MESDMTKKKEKGFGVQGLGGLGGILKGVGDLVEKLSDLAEKGEQLSRTGEVDFGGGGKDLKGVYGFSVKVGLGGEGVKVEPFGNIHKDETTGEAVVQEIREPIVDVFEEKDHILIVAEMPGVDTEDIRIDLTDDVLTLSAERNDKKYRKEILLPGGLKRDRMTVSCKNGIVEIKCAR